MSQNPAKLVRYAEALPANLENLLSELGAGDQGFNGTSFGRGECDLPAFLEECSAMEYGRNLPTGKVPQTTFWLLGENERAVGIVRVRPQLNERLLQFGGNIGYYVQPAARGKGYGKLALRFALDQLRLRRVERALLTVNPINMASIRVVLWNGGVPDAQGIDPVTGAIVNRYWIQL